MVIHEPPGVHTCRPPENRPRTEWRTVAPPLGFMRPEDRATAKPYPVPTPYPPGTVWRCSCGRAWVRRPGQHYGRDRTHTGGGWAPVRWYQYRLRRRAAVGDASLAYQAAARVVESYDPDKARP